MFQTVRPGLLAYKLVFDKFKPADDP